MRRRVAFKEIKKESWSETAAIVTSSSGISGSAAQLIHSNIWWRKHNEKSLYMDKLCVKFLTVPSGSDRRRKSFSSRVAAVSVRCHQNC